MSRPTLIVVRHGTTALNHSGGDSTERIRGWKNVPLDEHGQKQARAAADALAGTDYHERVHSSDLGRAYDTATEIAKRKRGVVIPVHGLRPWHLGEMSGKPVADVIDRMKHHILHEKEGVPGGESFGAFKERARHAWNSLLAEAVLRAPRPVVAVTHTRNARLLRGWLAAGARDKVDLGPLLAKDDTVAPGGHFQVEKHGGAWVMR